MLFIGVLIGGVLASTLLSSYNESLINESKAELYRNHSDAVLKARNSLNTYITIVSSIKAFVRNSEELPKAEVLQSFLQDVIKETDFNDSIVVSFLDNEHYFKYVLTPKVLDPKNIVGTRLSNLRPKKNLKRLDSLNNVENNIRLVEPLNLIEGWAALPFSFRVRDKKDSLLGYIAVTISSNYLLNYINKGTKKANINNRLFLFDSIPLVRNAFLDGTKIYTADYDSMLQRPLVHENVASSTIDFLGYGYKIQTDRVSNIDNNLFKLLTYFWYGSILLICFILFLQFKNRLKLKQELMESNGVVLSKNEELREKLENIGVLNREIHHRVKNNMQIMSSLLNLQRSSINDQGAKDALFDSNNRIHSMALVHKKLYDTRDFKKVNVYDYTKELIQHILKSLSDRRIRFTNNIDKAFYLDSDQMISVGLMVNELITNSIKYAFDELDGDEEIEITSTRKANGVIFSYRDNGNWTAMNEENKGGFGLELIQILSSNIVAEYNLNKEKSEFVLHLTKV